MNLHQRAPKLFSTLLFISLLCISGLSLAVTKLSAEEAFLQGQKQLEQGNIAEAEVSLTRIPTSSPYAKLLTGNIAMKNGDTDRAFLLLLPLQSNQSFNKVAAASLHASLSDAYDKQGDALNVLDQLIRREIYLTEPQTIASNQKNIWRLLSELSVETLINVRGETTDSISQGWVDLAIAAKNQESASAISAWQSSYIDHPAIEFAKSMALQQTSAPLTLTSNANIALILPFDNARYAKQAEAFKLGLEAALAKNAMTNEVKAYASIGDMESFADLRAFSKDEGAGYFIGPLTNEELSEADSDVRSVTLLDASKLSSVAYQHAGFSVHDEAFAMANFAKRHAIQRVAIVSTDNDFSQLQVASYINLWETELGYMAHTVTLPQDIKPGDVALVDLKAKLAEQPYEMLLIAASASDAQTIRPYLDISTPTLAFSNIHEITNDSNVKLTAVRFVDIPFLIDARQFAYYHEKSAELTSNEQKRWFALGVDCLQLLVASNHTANTDKVIDGLTGKITIDAEGQIKRELVIGKFGFDGIEIDQ